VAVDGDVRKSGGRSSAHWRRFGVGLRFDTLLEQNTGNVANCGTLSLVEVKSRTVVVGGRMQSKYLAVLALSLEHSSATLSQAVIPNALGLLGR